MYFASITRKWSKMIQLLLNKTTPHFQFYLYLRLISPNYAFMRCRLYSAQKVIYTSNTYTMHMNDVCTIYNHVMVNVEIIDYFFLSRVQRSLIALNHRYKANDNINYIKYPFKHLCVVKKCSFLN